MRGCLDDPPIVIKSSRWLPGLLVPIPVAFAAIYVWLLVYDPRYFIGYLFVGVAAFGSALLIGRLLSPPRLEMSRQGLAWFTGRKALRYDWNDFSGFCAYLPGRGFFKYVGYNYASSSPTRRTMSTNAFVIAPYVRDGIDGSFGGPWELPADDVVELLNQAKAKWGS